MSEYIYKYYRYIYITTNLLDNKKYIGQRTSKVPPEQDSYLGSGKILKYAIKKYGSQNFSKEIIELCDTQEQLNEREKFWISFYNAANDRNFYNIAEGGTGGNTYKGLSSEELERIKEIKRKQAIGSNNPNAGHIYSEQERFKMSEAVKAAYEAHKDTWGTTGLTGEKNSLSKLVYARELDKEFIGIREAARQTKIRGPNIIRSLQSNGKFSAGKINGKKIYWFYGGKDDYERNYNS